MHVFSWRDRTGNTLVDRTRICWSDEIIPLYRSIAGCGFSVGVIDDPVPWVLVKLGDPPALPGRQA